MHIINVDPQKVQPNSEEVEWQHHVDGLLLQAAAIYKMESEYKSGAREGSVGSTSTERLTFVWFVL